MAPNVEAQKPLPGVWDSKKLLDGLLYLGDIYMLKSVWFRKSYDGEAAKFQNAGKKIALGKA